jgi:hypothetical protein
MIGIAREASPVEDALVGGTLAQAAGDGLTELPTVRLAGRFCPVRRAHSVNSIGGGYL